VAVNSGVFWGRRSFIKHGGRIIVEFLPPIPPGLDRRAFLAELETRIEGVSERLCKEAYAAFPHTAVRS
jgi:1-acyl-sn-glycerol-3-phosphate acyltransferase